MSNGTCWPKAQIAGTLSSGGFYGALRGPCAMCLFTKSCSDAGERKLNTAEHTSFAAAQATSSAMPLRSATAWARKGYGPGLSSTSASNLLLTL
jgi:hypothetical protein